jgi:hypothetical protein
MVGGAVLVGRSARLELAVTLPELPQGLLDIFAGLLGLPGCTGAALGGLGQFSGTGAQLLPDPPQRLSGLPQFFVEHALPLCVGSFTKPADSDPAQLVLAYPAVGDHSENSIISILKAVTGMPDPGTGKRQEHQHVFRRLRRATGSGHAAQWSSEILEHSRLAVL